VETEGEFAFATSLDTKDTEQIAEFLEQSVKGEDSLSSLPGGLQPPETYADLDPSPSLTPWDLTRILPGKLDLLRAMLLCLLQTPARG
jgi:hypothetical protein